MKKILATAMAAVMLMSASVGLSGCAGSSGGGTIKWVQLGDKQPRSDEILAKANEIIEPELGLKLEIEYIDTASFKEKSKMKMAAGEKFDIIWTGYLNDYETAVSLGGLMDISDYIDNIEMKDGTSVKMSDVVEEYFIESAYMNGKIYGIPNAQVVSNPLAVTMRKSVADKCGIDLEGMKELALKVNDSETAKAYLDKVTEELAKAKSKMPELYTINPGSSFSASNVYEELIAGVGIRKDGTSNEIVNIKDTEEFKLGVDYVRDWYEKGYIRSDIASKGNALTSADEQRQYAFYQTTWKPGQAPLDAADMGEEMVYSLMAQPYVARTNPLLTMLSVGANSKNPEAAVKLIYMLNSNKELYNLLCWGIEGTDYKVNEDGTITEIKDSGYDEVGAGAWRYGSQFNSLLIEGQELTVWDETKKMNDEAVKSPALGFVINTDAITTEIANIVNVNSEYKAKVEFGTAAREEYWDEYMSKLDNAGIEKVRAEVQKQYDAFLAENN